MTFWHTLNPLAREATLRSRSSSNDASRAAASHSGDGGISSDPVLWAQELLGFVPDPAQAAILRSSASRLMLCCTRQFGKSTITAIKALHHAWTHPESLVLIAAPTARQAGEWLRKTHQFLERLGVRSRTDGVNRLSLKLPNGSRMVGLPNMPGNVRGFSKASLVLIDEAAFVADELYHALNPMLAVSRGGLWLMSTPGAQSGFFYEEWARENSAALPPFVGQAPWPAAGPPAGPNSSLPSKVAASSDHSPDPSVLATHPDGPLANSGPFSSERYRVTAARPPFVGQAPWPAAGPPAGPNSSLPSKVVSPSDHSPDPSVLASHPDGPLANSGPFAWERYRITAAQCPRIPPEFLAEQRIRLGDAVYRREYECEFVAAGTQIIDHALLDSALDDCLPPFNGGRALWR